MKKNINWLLRDKNNSIWNFYLDNESNLVYSIRKDKNWIDRNIIDKDVKEFYVDADCNNDVHVIYISDNKLKYCIIKNKELKINSIYDFTNSNYIMKEVKLVIVNNVVYIFCLIPNMKSKDEFVLMNYVWDRKKVRKSPVCFINKDNHGENYYDVELYNEKDVYVFYNDGNNIYAKCYKEDKWGEAEKIIDIDKSVVEYSITSNKEVFDLLITNNFAGKYELINVKLNKNFRIIDEEKYISENKIDNSVIIL